MRKHAVHELYEQRLARSTKPFHARGALVRRCHYCRIHQDHCICDIKPEAQSEAGFLILFYDDEVLKPSNSGKLIADLIPDTFAYLWSRTEVEDELLRLLEDPQWFPVVVFPATYAQSDRSVLEDQISVPSVKRPLFILLDGTWREAKKMFRKSPYLDRFPVLSVSPESLSRFQIRKSAHDHQLATAEVAAVTLHLFGERLNAQLLNTWFDLFTYRYQKGKTATNQGDPSSESRLRALLSD